MGQGGRQVGGGGGQRRGRGLQDFFQAGAGAGEAAVGRPGRRAAGEGDDCLLRLPGQVGENGQLGGIEFVETVHEQQPPIGAQAGLRGQGDGRQPAPPFVIGPFFLLQPALVLAVDEGQFLQARRLVGNGRRQRLRLNSGLL